MEDGDLIPVHLDADTATIAGLFDLSVAAAAIRANKWDLQEEINTIIEIARCGSSSERLAALKQYRSLIKDLAVLSGLVGKVEKSELTRHGKISTKHTASAHRLMLSLRKENDAPKSPLFVEHHRPKDFNGAALPSPLFETETEENSGATDSPVDHDRGANPPSDG